MGNLGKSFSKSKKGSTERRDKEGRTKGEANPNNTYRTVIVYRKNTTSTPQENLFLPEEKIMKGKKSIFRSSFGGQLRVTGKKFGAVSSQRSSTIRKKVNAPSILLQQAGSSSR